ncbi:phage tail sheath subtilisin-like domain-containing protein [Hydrocarboniphaga effusa]|uniref:phage tail sheath subtilisin-like domain-containing protein n=1 Tax=Hydrocarboniphaga effusa TaxID=243629 RepID=UPI003BABD08E
MDFQTIPVSLLAPGTYVEFDNSQANVGLAVQNYKTLLIGQRTNTGSVAALAPTKIFGGDTGSRYFGAGSQLALMVARYRAGNPFGEVWAIALDDNVAGQAAAGAITFAGTSTAAGTLNAYIDGERVQIAVPSGMTAAQAATAMAAAINAVSKLPVTAAIDGVNTSKVNLTAKNKGEAGNGLPLSTAYYDGDTVPAGLTATITAFTGGTANPVITAALAAVAASWYTSFVMPYIDAASTTAMHTELLSRWGGTVQRDGLCFISAAGTFSAIDTIGNSLNSPFLCLMGAQGSPVSTHEIAASVASQDAIEPDPARQRRTLPLTGILPPVVANRYTQGERNTHLKSGVATFYTDDAGVVRIDRLVTTYKTDINGSPDASYRDVETMRTLSYLRYTVRVRMSQKFPRHKLAQDGTPIAAGQPIVTPSVIRLEMIALYGDWLTAGLVEGGAALEQFKQQLVVVINDTDKDRVDIVLPPDLINRLYVTAAQIQFRS